MDKIHQQHSPDEIKYVSLGEILITKIRKKIYAITSASFSLMELENKATEIQVGMGNLDFTTEFERSRIQDILDLPTLALFFNAHLKEILNTQPIRNALMFNLKLNHISGLGAVATIDIFSLMMLYKNFGYDAHECKKLILSNMQKGIENEKPGMGMKEIIVAYIEKGYIDYPDILDHIDTYILGDKGSKGVCPYSGSHGKIEFINQIWETLENKFLPVLQETHKDRKDLNREELFYLGRYNEIKK